MMVCREMPMAAEAAFLNEHDTRLWRVVAHYVEQAQAKRDWSHLKNVLIDETSSKRGHRYVTNFVDATTRELLLMVEGHGVDAIAAFHGELAKHNGDAEKIELLSMEMKPAFIAGAHRYFTKAEVVFDHFHIMQMVGKAVDQVRKQLAWEGAQMKGSLWAIRGNSWTRSSSQMEKRQQLCSAYPKPAKALGLRDLLQGILKEEDPKLLSWLCTRASRSRLEPFVRLSRSIKKHWNGVVAFMRTKAYQWGPWRPSMGYSNSPRGWPGGSVPYATSASWPISRLASFGSTCQPLDRYPPTQNSEETFFYFM